MKELISATEGVALDDNDDAVKCAALALLKAIYLIPTVSVPENAPDVALKVLESDDPLSPCVTGALDLLVQLASCVALPTLRPLLVFFSHPFVECKNACV